MPSYVNIFTAVSLFLVTTNSTADDLFDMLKRMSEADQNRNYQGIFILRKSDKLSTLHVTHGVDSNGVWESLESLSGEPRKIIRHNKKVVSVYPDRKVITIRHMDDKRLLHPQLPDNIDQLALFYSMQRLDDDRIADHQTLVLDLLPRDQYRYGYRYWVDKDTGMLLRCDLLDEDRAVVEQMMFTSLDYLSETPPETFDLQEYERYQLQHLDDSKTHAKAEPVPQQWTVNRLPKGFLLTQIVKREAQLQIAANDNSTEAEASDATAPDTTVAPDLLHMVYSDGLASVSVFIEKNQGAGKHLQGASSMGAVNAYGNAVGEHYVTVVGEVPAKTVRSMAQSTIQIP
ncbi:MAG: MucB/RseB C-terminal domain-containing protein [Gammaproteobacteria bacterium]